MFLHLRLYIGLHIVTSLLLLVGEMGFEQGDDPAWPHAPTPDDIPIFMTKMCSSISLSKRHFQYLNHCEIYLGIYILQHIYFVV